MRRGRVVAIVHRAMLRVNLPVGAKAGEPRGLRGPQRILISVDHDAESLDMALTLHRWTWIHRRLTTCYLE